MSSEQSYSFLTISDVIKALTDIKSVHGDLSIFFHNPEHGLNDFIKVVVSSENHEDQMVDESIPSPVGKICYITDEQ